MATRKGMHERAEDVAVIRKVDADNRAAARKATLAPLHDLRRIRKEEGDLAAAKFLSQPGMEARLAAARALEREPPEPPKPTTAQREARIIANVQQRNADATAINRFHEWSALKEQNQARAAQYLDRHQAEVFHGRRLANETPNQDEPPPNAA